MWSFLKGIELLFILSFILGFLAKGFGGVFKAIETFVQSVEPSLASMAETNPPILSSVEVPTTNQQLITLLQEGGYLKDGKVDAMAIDRAIETPSSS